MATVIKTTFQFKRGTAQRWKELNPILQEGEPGYELDTQKLKIGNGYSSWRDLPYLQGSGGGSVTPETREQLIFEFLVSAGEDHNSAIDRYLNGLIPGSGDIAILKENIYNNERFAHTAYIFSENKWLAFDGNYNANNVYFNTDFTFTKPIGVIDIPDSGSITVEATGKNLQDFLKSIFAEEEYPNTPSVSVTLNSSNIKAYEVGTKIAIDFSFNTNVEQYKYGPDTNVNWTKHKATFNGETIDAAAGKFKEIQVKDNTSLKITGSCSNSDGAIPKTNLGNDYPAAQIKEKNWTGLEKGTLTGYRAWFCGYKNGDNALTDPTAITGEQIRALGNSANGSWKSQLKVDKMKQMYFTAPKGKGYKPVIKDASTTAPQTVQGPFEVQVPGANEYEAITYEIWYVANADAASGSATLNITKS